MSNFRESSQLNIRVRLDENSITPDATNISEILSTTIQSPAVSLAKRIYTAGQQARLIQNPNKNDKMVYIKNAGVTDFSVQEATGGGSVGNTYAAIASGEVMLFRLKKNIDIWLTNVSNATNGKIEFSYWECKSNV